MQPYLKLISLPLLLNSKAILQRNHGSCSFQLYKPLINYWNLGKHLHESLHKRKSIHTLGIASLWKNTRKGNHLNSLTSVYENVKKYSEIKNNKMVNILNVAEKNDAAKNIAEILSRGGYRKREGFSKFNKIYYFDMMLHGQQCHMIMTSVSGHLLNQSFTGNYKKWLGCNPLDLFDAPVVKVCQENMQTIKQTLERESRYANRLIIWTDCDREGENIGFEVISVCTSANPNLQVNRAKFSEITFQSVNRAIQNLGLPDEKQNNAVEVRSELDLRIGAAFTRFQTLRLQKVFPQGLAQTLISYGSCQFPTLGFVVERYKAIEEFIPERFWKIKVSHEVEDCVVEFHWRRVRLFDHLACQVLHDRCVQNPRATVKSVKSKTKSKWRPLPLDTVEFEKLASRKLKITAKETMRIAEKLYTSGFISYPRTETNIFPKELDLRPLIQVQTVDNNWGAFASRVLTNGPIPRQGKKSDQAHPPIHPTKHATNLQGNEQRIYEFVVRHFLACCDRDAKGTETIVQIDIADEEFLASGLIILERNYLDVYPYEKWSDKEMPHYVQGQQFEPSAIDLFDGQTSAPPLLTEADLISLMEKHGIGTDATHADHIETIKNRLYVGVRESHFVPGELGMGLVEGYDAMGFHMSKPNLRAELEADLKRICDGVKDPKVVLKEQIDKYRNVFRETLRQASKIDVALARFLDEAPQMLTQDVAIPNIPQEESTIMKCISCNSDIVVKSRRDGRGFFISCNGYPACKAAIWLPQSVTNVKVLDEKCQQCIGKPRKLKFTFSARAYSPILPSEYETCIGGCDSLFMETLDIKPFSRPQRRDGSSNTLNTPQDSGYSTASNNSFTPTGSNVTRLVLANRTNAEVTRNAPDVRPVGVRGRFAGASQSQTNLNVGRSGRGVTPSSSHHSGLNDRSHGGSGETTFSSNKTSSRGRGNFMSTSRGRTNATPSSGMGLNGANDGVFPTSTSGPYFGSGRGSSNNTTQSEIGWGSDADEENPIVCVCNEDAIKLTVRKEGPNTGRQFYKCSKPQGQGCNFFLWAEEKESSNRMANPSLPGNKDSGRENRFGSSSNFTPLRDENLPSSSNNFSTWGDEFTSEESDEATCHCGIFAKRLTTMKEGPNKGREFYVCPKTRDEQCGYFKWVDEFIGGPGPGPGPGTGPGPGPGPGPGRSSWGSANQSTNKVSLRGNRSRGRGSTRGGGQKRKLNSTTGTPQKRKCGLCGEEGHDRRICPHV